MCKLFSEKVGSKLSFNPLPHMPTLGSSNSAANKDMMSKIWTNEDTIILLSRKHCGQWTNCSLRAIYLFPTLFSKAVLLMHQNEYLCSKGRTILMLQVQHGITFLDQ